MSRDQSIKFASPEYEFEDTDIAFLKSLRGSGLYSGKALAKQSPIQRAGRSSLKGKDVPAGFHSPQWRSPASQQQDDHSRPATSQRAFSRPMSSQDFRPEVSPIQSRREDARANTVGGIRTEHGSDYRQTLQMDNVGLNSFSVSQTIQGDSKAFYRKRPEDSCAHFAEQKHNMRNFEGTVHPLRDPLNRQPPKTGYTYSRVNKDFLELTPYDYDETQAISREIGYTVGHIRNMSNVVKDKFGRTRPATVWSRDDTRNENESVSTTAHLHRYDLITVPKDTRFDSFAIRNDWNKDYYKKCEEKQQRQAHKKHLKNEQKIRDDITKETRNAIHAFEENLKAISSKKM